MRFKVILLLMMVWVGVTATPASAQDAPTWYYGIRPETGEVFAYTAEGDVNILLEGIEDYTRIMRLNDRSAFGLFERTDTPDVDQLYALTPEAASPLTLSFDLPDVDETEFEYALQAYTDRYAVFASTFRAVGGYGLLADFEAGTITLLSEQKINNIGLQVHFSEDGRLLRYVRLEGEGMNAWSLVERNLETGDEHVFFTGEGYPNVGSNASGDYWLAQIPQPESETAARDYVLIDTEGSTRIVVETSRDAIVGARLFDDSVFTWSFDCAESCTASLQSIEGDDSHTFAAPPVSSMMTPLGWVNETQLLVLSDELYYVLSEDAAPQFIGLWDTQHIVDPPAKTLSPDGRFLLALTGDQDDTYGVWDFDRQEYVVEATPERFPLVSVVYSDAGFIVTNGFVNFVLYRADDGMLAELPDGAWFDMLADADVLGNIRDDHQELAPGIYRYDVDEDAFTLLVEGGQAIMR